MRYFLQYKFDGSTERIAEVLVSGRLQTILNPKMKIDFQNYCQEQGFTMSEVIRALIKNHLDENKSNQEAEERNSQEGNRENQERNAS